MLQILCLQHPQEPDKAKGSVPILKRILGDRFTQKVGLSWANISKALGTEAKPSEWLVLFLGTRKQAQDALGKPGLHWLKPKTTPTGEELRAIKGVIVLDGTWSQAKTLWWRNAWLMKCKRAFLVPHEPSAYGRKRKEPSPECVSTLEAVAETLTLLGESQETETRLKIEFREFVKTI